MRLTQAIDDYLCDMRQSGRINSDVSERSYRDTLMWHAEDVANRDPRIIGRDDIKRTLRRWSHPNTAAKRRSYLVSFYDWCMEEGYRKDNPARQVRRPKRRPVEVYRMTFEETVRLLMAAHTHRERRATFLLTCAGIRNAEARNMQGRHFERDGWVWASPDIAKGGKGRDVPIIADLRPVVDEIRRNVGHDQYILPAQRVGNPGKALADMRDYLDRPCSQQSLGDLIATVAKRAGIAAHIHPHLLRHAYADHIARYAGMRNAQFLLGHSSVSTTEGYLGKPTLDELKSAVTGFSFGNLGERLFSGAAESLANPLTPPAGFEPADSARRAVERDSGQAQSDTTRSMARILSGLWASPTILRAALRLQPPDWPYDRMEAVR